MNGKWIIMILGLVFAIFLGFVCCEQINQTQTISNVKITTAANTPEKTIVKTITKTPDKTIQKTIIKTPVKTPEKTIVKTIEKTIVKTPVEIIISTPIKTIPKITPKTIVEKKPLNTSVILVSATKMKDNTHVGHEWDYVVKANGKTLVLGQIINIPGTSIKVMSKVTENDSIPDVGSNSMSLKEGDNVLLVTITENKGRYSGETEIWKFVVNAKFI